MSRMNVSEQSLRIKESTSISTEGYKDSYHYFHGWDNVIPKEIQLRYSSTTRFSNENEALATQIHNDVSDLFRRIYQGIDNSSKVIRRIVISADQDDMRIAFAKLQNAKSLKTYISYSSRLICFLCHISTENPTNLPNNIIECIKKYTNSTMTTRARCLQEMLMAVMCQTVTFKQKDDAFALYQFLLFSSILTNGNRLRLGAISSNIAILKYLLRGIMLVNIVDNDMDHETFSDRKLQNFLVELKPTPFNMLCQEGGSIAAGISDQEKLPRIYFPEGEQGQRLYHVIIWDGMRLSMNDLIFFCDKMQNLCSVQCDQLLLNFNDVPDLCGMKDSMHNTTKGFWFGAEIEKGMNEKFLNHLYNNSNLRRYWFSTNGKVMMSAGRRYLTDMHNFLSHLLVLIHVSSGAPPRATETVRCLIRNQLTCKRTIFLQDGYICMIQRYSKTRGKAQRDTFIARFLTPDISILLYKYLIVIRCFSIFLIQELNLDVRSNENPQYDSTDDEDLDDEPSSQIHNSASLSQTAAEILCWNKHGAMTGSTFRTIFKKYFVQILNVELTFSAYRQISGAFVDKLIAPNLPSHQQSLPFAAQTGHTHETAMKWYGLSNVDHPALSRDRFDAFKLCSRYWQGLLKLTGGYQLDGGLSNTPIHPENKTLNLLQSAEGLPFDIGIWEQVITFFTKIASSAIPRQSLLSQEGFPNIRGSADLGSLESINESAKSIYGAKFKWLVPEQMTAALMLHTEMNNRKDGIVHMPTGSGKSLLFMIRAKFNANLISPKIVIVIFPLKSILLNMSQRLKV